jgi:hypothetical protein
MDIGDTGTKSDVTGYIQTAYRLHGHVLVPFLHSLRETHGSYTNAGVLRRRFANYFAF